MSQHNELPGWVPSCRLVLREQLLHRVNVGIEVLLQLRAADTHATHGCGRGAAGGGGVGGVQDNGTRSDCRQRAACGARRCARGCHAVLSRMAHTHTCSSEGWSRCGTSIGLPNTTVMGARKGMGVPHRPHSSMGTMPVCATHKRVTSSRRQTRHWSPAHTAAHALHMLCGARCSRQNPACAHSPRRLLMACTVASDTSGGPSRSQ
jgi:hypothetical protein